MTGKLFFQALGKFFAGLIVVSALLFVPAGTLKWPAAWLFLGILFIPMFAAGIVMMIRSPQLLRKRLNAKEEQKEQKTVIVLSGVMFLCAFVAAGLNFIFPLITALIRGLLIGSYSEYADRFFENM